MTTLDQDIFLVEIEAYNPDTGDVDTLRYCTGTGFVTGPAETPPNVFYDGRVHQALKVGRTMFAPGTTRGRCTVALGDILLNNLDNELDPLANYGFDGRTVTVRRGRVGAAYPGGFTTEFVGTMATPELTQERFTIRLRDRVAELNVPLQTTKLAGDNALPLGLEGNEDLAGVPKPVCYGKVFNVAPPCVNTSKLIYQLADKELDSVDAVYDRGILLQGLHTFTQRNSGFGVGNSHYGIAYGAGVFVAVGGGGIIRYSNDKGATWQAAATNPLTGSDIPLFVAFLNGVFLCGTSGATGKLVTSPDGINWTARTTGFGANSVNCATHGSSVWVIAGSNGTLATSPDLVTWTLRTSGLAVDIRGLAFGNGRFALTGTTSTRYSADAITWNAGSATLAQSMRKMIYVAELRRFIAVGDAGAIYTSEEGIHFTAASNSLRSTDYMYDVAHGQGLILAVTDNSVSAVSYDGKVWFPHYDGASDYAVGTDGLGNWLRAGNGTNAIFTSTPAGNAYTSTTELLDDALAPLPGSYKVLLSSSGSYLRLGAPQEGVITCDLTEGATSADRTTAQLFKRVLEERAGMSASDYSGSDLTALDTAAPGEVGLWYDHEVLISAVLDRIAGSPGAAWFVDAGGDYRIAQLEKPSGSPVFTFSANEVKGRLRRLPTNEQGQGLPAYSVILRWGRNHAPSSDLAAGVSSADRGFFQREWRSVESSNAAVQIKHPLAIQLEEDTLFADVDDAQEESNRRLELRCESWSMFELPAPLDDDTRAIELADVVGLVHDRFGLTVEGDADAGGLFVVIGVAPDAESRTVVFTLWGTPKFNLIADDGTFLVTDDGVYLVAA